MERRCGRIAAIVRHIVPTPAAAAEGAAPSSLGDDGPLTGVRILDASQMLSGPMGCCLLGDQGADVVKIEPLSGDSVRAMAKGMSSTFSTINRNKRSLAVDLKNPEGLQVLYQLVKTADVFVQNFRPGAAERMQVGYADLQKIKPDLIYVSISGFGPHGPYKDKRVYDPVIQAVSGLASIQADAEGRPHFMRTIIPDKVSAMTLAQAVPAALFQRSRTGQGQHVQFNMLDAVIAFHWPEGMAKYTFGDLSREARKPSFYVREMVYRCRDGQYITAGTVTLKEWHGLCQALDRPQWLEDPRFQDAAGLNMHREVRLKMIEDAVAGMDSADALARLDKCDVPCAPIHHPIYKMVGDPQVKANGTVAETVHPHAGRMRYARPAAKFGAAPLRLRRHAPLLGEHTAEVLAELGIPAERIRELHRKGVVASATSGA